MAETLTLREVADHFADQDAVADPQEREARYQRLRAIVQQGMVMSDVEVSKGKTAAFGAVKIAQLRVLQALMESGFKGPVLWKFNAHLNKTPITGEAGHQPGTMIAKAAAGTMAGEDWHLDIRVTRRPDADEPEYLGGLRRADEPRNPVSDQILAAGRVVYAAVSLPVSDLIRPVLAVLEAE